MKKVLIVISVIITILTSCDLNKIAEKPGSTGATYELLVVCDKDLWNSPIGDTVKSFFQQSDTTLFMDEPLFKMPNIDMKQLEDNKMYQFYKSMMIIEFDSASKARVESKDTIWAKPQRIFKIVAPNKHSFDSVFNVYKYFMLEKYIEIERSKLQLYYSSAKNKDVIKKIGQKFGYTLTVPTGFYIAKDKEDFMWLRSETTESSTNFLIYSEDYKGESQLSPSYIKLRRNIITESNIPCSLDGSYAMIVDDFELAHKVVTLNGMYSVETRGAWECFNDFMGGTFINYTIVDEEHNKILTIDGFVYFPNKEKRVLMMQLESLIWTLQKYNSEK